MSREEDLIRSTTHAIASTVRDVPPLNLDTAADELRSRTRGPRRPGGNSGSRHRDWGSWAAPLTAAALVIALAVALVLIKDTPDGSANVGSNTVLPTADSTAINPSGSGPGGVPRYYVAIQDKTSTPAGKGYTKTTSLVVGDSLTGGKLTTIAAPPGITFLDVTAAADDRTFVVAGQDGSGASATIELFEIRLDPGTSHQAQMTSLPVKPQPVAVGLIGAAFPVALSSSGTELAVAEFDDVGEMAVKVFSVATGNLLHEWTTTDRSLSLVGLSMAPALTWIDNDRAVTLATLGTPTRSDNSFVARQTVRRLNVSGPASGDLIADSTVLRDDQAGGTHTCDINDWPPVISADGKTFTCATGSSFVTYLLDASPADYSPKAGTPIIDDVNRTDLSTGQYYLVSVVLWTSKSGGTLIAEWGASSSDAVQSSGKGVQISVISHGTSTPLRFPPGFAQVSGGDIAW